MRGPPTLPPFPPPKKKFGMCTKCWLLILVGCKYICAPAKFDFQPCQTYVWLAKWVINEIIWRKMIAFINCTPMGMSPLISISKFNSVIAIGHRHWRESRNWKRGWLSQPVSRLGSEMILGQISSKLPAFSRAKQNALLLMLIGYFCEW